MIHPYANPDYARALTHMGKALEIPAWGTSVILREVKGGGVDAVGVYPITVLPNDADIMSGLSFLKDRGVISLVMVLDDIHRPDLEILRSQLTILRPFKTHYIYVPANGAVVYDQHHRRALRKAQSQVQVSLMDFKQQWQSWNTLYDYIVTDMRLSGTHVFPPSYHQKLGELEGITAIGAWVGDYLVSCHVWAVDDYSAVSHLVASNAAGYETRAAYAVNNFSLEYFSSKHSVNFGGGAGYGDDMNDGLARFKRGFSNGTAQSYIAGVILDEARYRELSGSVNTNFFPAYRAV